MSMPDAHQSLLSYPTICSCVLFLYLASEHAVCLSLSFIVYLLIMTTIPFLYSASLVTLLLSICRFILFGALRNYLSLNTSKDLERCAGPQGHGTHWYRLEHGNVLGRPLSANFLSSPVECVGVECLF
mgnify:CR=1 FL=1